MDSESVEHLLPAAEAADLLGVKLATLYAYASRGVVTSHRKSGHRGSWFDPVELDQVARRSRSRSADRLSDMQFQSAVTLVEGGRYHYRGEDPLLLASTASFESVCAVLWNCEPVEWRVDEAAVRLARAAASGLGAHASALDRVRVAVPIIGSHDQLRFDVRPAAVAGRAGDIMATLTAAASSSQAESHAQRVWATLAPTIPAEAELAVVEAALILLADHEVAASTAAVRIAASFRADPFAVVGSGLAVLSGAYHGAASVDVARMLRDAVELGAAHAVGDALRDTGRVPGLGQVLYPDGDPRFGALMEVLATSHADHPAVVAALEVQAIAADRGFPPPNVDFGLAAAVLALDLGLRAGETIFAFARMAGWLAHAIEEYAQRTDLRLRANYVGPRPSTSSG